MASQSPSVDVLGAVTVRSDDGVVTGAALGGRRARVALVALALAEQPIPAERLAAMVWQDDPPPTWPVALRGVISALRTAVSKIGLGEQRLIETVPSGYVLSTGVQVNVRVATAIIRRAEELLALERYGAALEEARKATSMDGAALLSGEDLEWLAPQRQAIDETRLRALEIVIEAAGRSGDDFGAIAAARHAVVVAPLDERAHRALIRALDRAGDRAAAVTAYEQCRSLLADQLGIDPSRESVEVYLAALGTPSAPGSPGRPPREQSTFIGREAEMGALAAALSDSRLVCVTGKGGVGKSRLAQQVALRASGFAGGRFWVPLAAISDDELVASSVALSLGVHIGAEDPEQAITRHLAPLGPTLVVLDGGELVLDGVASLVAALLGGCPSVTVLVTSRALLGVAGGALVAVMPMLAPSTDPETLLCNDGVRLLVDRVREGGGTLAVNERTAPLVAALCAQCGGLPLALELVAAQLCVMPVGDLLDQLFERVLGDDRLRSVLAGGHALLDRDEAAVFRRFAVLEGAVGLSLIKTVTAGADVAPLRVVRVLRELAARGMLTVDTSGARSIYRQDDDVHRFAREQLEASGESRDTFHRLADAMRALLPDDPRAAPAAFEQQIIEVRESVHSLLAAAVAGSADRDHGLEIAFRLHRYWAATNVAEGRFWLARLLAADPVSPWTSYAMFAAGYLSYWSGDAEKAVAELGSAAEMLRGVDDSYRARALIYLGGLADDLDRGDDAISYVRQAIKAAAAYGADLQVSAAMGMACVLAERADPLAARFAADAIALCRASGSAEQLSAAMPTAAMVCWQVGDLDAARAYVAEARPMHSGGRRIARVVLLSTATGIALADNDIGAAVDFGRAADAEATELGVEREVPLIRTLLARALLAAGDVASAADRAAAAIAAARSLSFDFPFACCLETAALVAQARLGDLSDLTDLDARRSTDLRLLLSVAAELRARGNRPAPPTLRAALARLTVALTAAGSVGIDGGPGQLDRASLDRTAGTAVDLLRAPGPTR